MVLAKKRTTKEARVHLGSFVAGLINRRRGMSKHVTAALFDQPAKPAKRGWPRGRHTAFKRAVIQHFGDHFPDSIHLNDATFKVFLGMMALRYASEQNTPPSIDLYLALIDFCLAAFDLLKEAGISNTNIGFAHKYTLPEIEAMLKEIEVIFGQDPEAARIAGTAFYRVMHGSYPSVEAAKTAHDQIVKDAKRIFGKDSKTKALVNTARTLVFNRTYPSVEIAKETYDEIFKEAQEEFGQDPRTKRRVRSIANYVLRKIYPSVEKAKEIYNNALDKALESFGEDVDAAHLTAGLVLDKKYASAEKAMTAYNKILTRTQKVFNEESGLAHLAKRAAKLIFMKRYSSATRARDMYLELSQAIEALNDVNQSRLNELWRNPQSPETQGILKRYKALEEKNDATPPTDASKFHRGRRR